MSYIYGDGGRSKWYKDNYCAFVYSEKRALTKNCYSGERLTGTLHYRPQTFSDLSRMTDRFSTPFPLGVDAGEQPHHARFVRSQLR